MFRTFWGGMFIFIALVVPAQATTTYHVGNSLTWDSRPMWLDQFAAQKGLAGNSAGWHIHCGRSLAATVAFPDELCVTPPEPYGAYLNALPGFAWDAITLQAYPGGTLGSETTAAVSMINLARQNPANANTPIYLLTGWPQSTDFVNTWNLPIADDDATTTTISRQYFEILRQRLTDQTDSDIYIIPSGEVLYQLDQRMHAGEVPGFTDITQLYRDVNHLTYTVGRYVAATTMFSTLYGLSPAGLTDPDADPATYTPELYAALNAVVWDVVSDYSATIQPGDANGDGLVNVADLQILGDHWQSTAACWAQSDFTGDDIVNLADLQVIGDNWGYGNGTDLSFEQAIDRVGVVIPEPISLVMMVLGAPFVLLRDWIRCTANVRGAWHR